MRREGRESTGPVSTLRSAGHDASQARKAAARSGVTATLAFGAFARLATDVGWVAMSLGIVYLFEQRSLKLWLVNAGCQVVTYTLMGAVIGGWK